MGVKRHYVCENTDCQFWSFTWEGLRDHLEANIDHVADNKPPKKYWVFWTFGAGYANKPVQVEATTIEEAIRKEWHGERVRYLVFEEGGTLVHDGPLGENKIDTNKS